MRVYVFHTATEERIAFKSFAHALEFKLHGTKPPMTKAAQQHLLRMVSCFLN